MEYIDNHREWIRKERPQASLPKLITNNELPPSETANRPGDSEGPQGTVNNPRDQAIGEPNKRT